jgi:hypothetical protein
MKYFVVYIGAGNNLNQNAMCFYFLTSRSFVHQKFTTYCNFSIEEVIENSIKPQTIVVKTDAPSKN